MKRFLSLLTFMALALSLCAGCAGKPAEASGISETASTAAQAGPERDWEAVRQGFFNVPELPGLSAMEDAGQVNAASVFKLYNVVWPGGQDAVAQAKENYNPGSFKGDFVLWGQYRYGCVLNDGSEGFLVDEDGALRLEAAEHTPENGHYALHLSSALIKELEAAGFSPETTEVCALNVTDGLYGILFYDGEKERLQYTNGKIDQGLEIDRLYTMEELFDALLAPQTIPPATLPDVSPAPSTETHPSAPTQATQTQEAASQGGIPQMADDPALLAFEVDAGGITGLRIYNHQNLTYVSAPSYTLKDQVSSAFSHWDGWESEQLGSPVAGLSMLELEQEDGGKYSYTFYENGIETVYAPVDGEAGAVHTWAADGMNSQKVYGGLLDVLRAAYDGQQKGPAWLGVMRKSRVQRITVSDRNPEYAGSDAVSRSFTPGQAEFDRLFSDLQKIRVKPDSFDNRISDLGADSALVQVEFTNGVTYKVMVDDSAVCITSNDMSFPVKYDLLMIGGDLPAGPDGCHFREIANPSAGEKRVPNTAKPVIYLYPEAKTDVTVKLDYQGDFTCTYPAYQDGWRVTAYPDGRLVNRADGSEHYYLFWEGDEPVDWEFERGFVVKGSEAQAFLTEKLSYMGLTPREYNDFIVYWLPELQQNDYNLITFSTEQYEELAPLKVSPQPDSILRVHMVYKAIPAPIEIPEQVLSSFARRGFTVVEWGGSRAFSSF